MYFATMKVTASSCTAVGALAFEVGTLLSVMTKALQ